MKKLKCGCEERKILKSEKKDYPEGTTLIFEKFCKEHKKLWNRIKSQR